MTKILHKFLENIIWAFPPLQSRQLCICF